MDSVDSMDSMGGTGGMDSVDGVDSMESVDGVENMESIADPSAKTGLALIAFTRRGCALACSIADGLSTYGGFAATCCSVSGTARFAAEFGIEAYESLDSWTARSFSQSDALIYVGAAGIAVRAIAPYVRDKFSDPAVVSIDEAGRFAVPLLSGHVGGANDLARVVAHVTGAQAVVSTATDVNELFAVDEWAARRGMRVVERKIAKLISARLLEGGVVGFATDLACDWDVPASAIGAVDDLGFAVTYDESYTPFTQTLHLIPGLATVGVGCRRDTDPHVLSDAVDAALAAAHVPASAVGTLASIDVKEDELAIRELAAAHGWELRFYTAEQLCTVPGEFVSSDFVKRTVGVDNVCERSALAQGGRLVLGKQASSGTTVAIAVGLA